MASYTESRHIGFSGNNLWELGMHGQYVNQARDRLTNATRAEGRARTRNLIQLSRLIMVNGDPLEAAAFGTEALDGAGLLRSRRALDDLRRLAEPHTHYPEIADLRHRIRTIVAV